MALPNIPTSFVPYSSSTTARHFRSDFTGAFAFLGYGVLLIMFAISLGVFLYAQVLGTEKTKKDAQLLAEIQKIDQSTIATFVRLRDRLDSSQSLLSGHVALSGFFESIGALLPSSVRFSSMHVSVPDPGGDTGPKIDAVGIAKNFNALAVVSQNFAADKRFKDALFSNITIGKDNSSVSFSFSAELDDKIVAFSVAGSTQAPVAPVAPETSTSTPTTKTP